VSDFVERRLHIGEPRLSARYGFGIRNPHR
jgi:hypothetical protein